MKKFKKIYLEITNICNLNCSFCNKTKRKQEFINKQNFISILKQIEDYTDYLYLHVMGEPLLHPDINELITIASNSFKVNLTTNGSLLNKISNNQNLRQINISLHSLTNELTLEKDLLTILNNSNHFLNTIINYRIWIKNNLSSQIITIINQYYNVNIDPKKRKNKIKDNIYISFEEEFTWPNLDNEKSYFQGTCLALKDHIGILVDGTVVPCCLDSNGIIKLGNILNDSLANIISSSRAQKIAKGFQNNIKLEQLCQKCNFYNNRKEK